MIGSSTTPIQIHFYEHIIGLLELISAEAGKRASGLARAIDGSWW
jgi:hypothetical protein